MDYFFTEEQKKIKALARKIAKEKIEPVRRELDEKEGFSHSIVKELANADMFKIFIPKEYSGFGYGSLELCLVVEELAKVCAGVATTYAACALAATPIILFGNEEQKQKYLTKIANGTLSAFGLTESEAGSDAGNVKTKSIKDGDFYIINGTKQWITNGGEAEIYVIITSTNPERGARGLSAFIVEKGQEGFTFGKLEDKLGIRASATRELNFDNCRVPKQNLLGKEGLGFIIAMKTFDNTRIGVGGLSLGIAQGALETAINYAKEHKLMAKERIQSIIAEMSSKIEAARALVYSVARYVDSGAKDISSVSSMAKLFASDTAMEVATNAVQILGEAGCIKDYAVEKMFRDTKITQIYEGTNEIQKTIIASSIAKKRGE